jgi:hypothetical protein
VALPAVFTESEVHASAEFKRRGLWFGPRIREWPGLLWLKVRDFTCGGTRYRVTMKRLQVALCNGRLTPASS